jgi:beta-lactamase class A
MERMRSVLRVLAASAVLSVLAGCAPIAPEQSRVAAPSASADTAEAATTAADFAALERRFDARLGVSAIDTGSGREVVYRADERFGFASTYKALAAAALLRTPPAGGLDQRVHYSAADLVEYSPITERHVDTGMTLREVADAAIRYSDNTAGNLLLDALGGPDALDASLRRIGDTVTDSERYETELNVITPGQTRDTSTPRALARDLRAYAVGSALAPDARAQLTRWLVGNTTGDALIRAAVPSGWTVGDKTGAADHATRNDIAVVWPPGRRPIVIAVLSDRVSATAKYDDALVAEAARVVLHGLGAVEQ